MINNVMGHKISITDLFSHTYSLPSSAAWSASAGLQFQDYRTTTVNAKHLILFITKCLVNFLCFCAGCARTACYNYFYRREYGMFVKHIKVEIYFTKILLTSESDPDKVVPAKFSKADKIGEL